MPKPSLERRLESLERKSETVQSVLLIIGEPTPEQQAKLDGGQYRVALFIPDNGREAVGANERD